MDFAFSISRAFEINPFSLLEEKAENVIMWMNYFIEKGEEETPQKQMTKAKDQPQRIRVNDKTASGGWF